jgi:hypothetical protein
MLFYALYVTPHYLTLSWLRAFQNPVYSQWLMRGSLSEAAELLRKICDNDNNVVEKH